MFFKKKKKSSMTEEQIRKLDKKQLKYVTQRDYETGGEKKLGDPLMLIGVSPHTVQTSSRS
ncbi:MAG: hypothetical protein K2N36_00520, partial [Ruminiclostridium sp.]|nr:hypothetical protein [Ruminiclostridium sp.]